MNALVKATGFWIVIVDETGPLNCMSVPSASGWRDFTETKLVELARAAFPGMNVLGAKWAEQPRKYTISDDVLLVSIPGTHEVAKPRAKVAPKPRRAVVQVRAADFDRDDRWNATYWRHTRMPAPVIVAKPLDAVAVVHTCSCGKAYTAASWAVLELVSAKDERQGDIIEHQDFRNCTCGSTRMLATTRIAGDGHG